MIDIFYYSEFDSLKHSNKVLGTPFSSNLYYIDQKPDTAILLRDNQTYQDIKDLYISVATPPGLTPLITVLINNTPINNLKIINNTIRIKNAFPNNLNYKISIYGKFITPKKQFYKNDSLIMNIKKG